MVQTVIDFAGALDEGRFAASVAALLARREALRDGIEKGGGRMRLMRIRHTADTSFLGLSAARLSGSGIGIGIQAKGTAVIHQKDRLPHNNLELFSNAPVTNLDHYRALGENAAQYARGDLPAPVIGLVCGLAAAFTCASVIEMTSSPFCDANELLGMRTLVWVVATMA